MNRGFPDRNEQKDVLRTGHRGQPMESGAKHGLARAQSSLVHTARGWARQNKKTWWLGSWLAQLVFKPRVGFRAYLQRKKKKEGHLGGSVS